MPLSSISDNILYAELARRHLLSFTTVTMPEYSVNWHHKAIADKLQLFADGKIKKLMLFVPPQHGKSELASKRLPAYLLGKNPNAKIIGASYNDTFAAKHNRAIQRIIDTKEYSTIFPDTKLNSKNVAHDSKGAYLRNSSEFEIVGKKGSYKSVGVGGGITGNPVDVGIMDDLIKGNEAANSKTQRDKIWDWYIEEFLTRLHNDSKQLLIMTRWHYDDIAGRLIEQEAAEWEIINFPAILETPTPGDKRKIGEALWEEKHSLARLLKTKKNYPKTFYSLYQGNPQPSEGGLFKKEHFKLLKPAQFQKLNWLMYIDGAYTKETINDPTGIMIVGKWLNKLHVKYAESRHLEISELIKWIDNLCMTGMFDAKNKILIEPKASGITLRQLLNKKGYNAVDIKNKYINKSKEERAEAAEPYVSSDKVIMHEGSWNKEFVNELIRFPNGKHDEHIDLLSYAIIDNLHAKNNTKLITTI